jgi:hypothetical protein
MLSAACVPGCLRGKVEIVVQRDGSGTIRQEFTLAEHAVVALDESPVLPGEEKPAITEQAIREALESTVTIEQVEIKDLPDGSRYVQWSGRFNDITGFLLSDAGEEFCGLSLERNGEDRIALRCNVYGKRGHVPQGSINWLYGIAKGMHYETTVTFPGTLVETDGQVDPERPNGHLGGRSARREGFERLKALVRRVMESHSSVCGLAAPFEVPAKRAAQCDHSAGPSGRRVEHGSQSPSRISS